MINELDATMSRQLSLWGVHLMHFPDPLGLFLRKIKFDINHLCVVQFLSFVLSDCVLSRSFPVRSHQFPERIRVTSHQYQLISSAFVAEHMHPFRPSLSSTCTKSRFPIPRFLYVFHIVNCWIPKAVSPNMRKHVLPFVG